MTEAKCKIAQIVQSWNPKAVSVATALAVLALAARIVVCGRGTALANDSEFSRSTAFVEPSIDTQAQSSGGSQCETSDKHEISINCDYVAAKIASKKNEPVIVLNHASISFEANHESQLHIELTFTQQGRTRFATDRPGYLAINGESGENYMRRVLPHLDFRKLTAGVAATFSDEFLAPALRPGRYLVQLWIPDPNPSLKFDAAHNFLLGNTGVPDQTTGLNTIASIRILR